MKNPTTTILLYALANVADARFSQEQLPAPAIGAVTSGGGPGVAATLAGNSIQFLLAAANPCGKLKQADDILTQLGTGADAVAAARGLVAAEQNFNPNNVAIPSICSEKTLPVNPLLRGVIPLVDPAVGGADGENTRSKSSLTTPFDATGLSVADVMVAQGFSNFTAVALDGTKSTPAATATVAAPAAAKNATESTDKVTTPASPAKAKTCKAATTPAAAIPAVAATPKVEEAPKVGASNGTSGTTTSAIDFGSCTPTMNFIAGRAGRAADEFTYAPTDAKIGGQEAKNPNIITDRTCNQLVNVCGLTRESPGVAACQAAKTQIAALTARDITVADAWNKALGFSGVDASVVRRDVRGLTWVA